MKPMRYNKHWAIMLILLICSVYLLLLFSPRERKNKENAALSNEWSITTSSLKEFNKRSEKLRNEVDKIAARTKERFIKEDTPSEVIKQSKTIIYNRIDKAGSTTLISINIPHYTVSNSTIFFQRLYRTWHSKIHFS